MPSMISIWVPPVTAFLNRLTDCGSGFCFVAVMTTPFVVDFMVLTLGFAPISDQRGLAIPFSAGPQIVWLMYPNTCAARAETRHHSESFDPFGFHFVTAPFISEVGLRMH